METWNATAGKFPHVASCLAMNPIESQRKFEASSTVRNAHATRCTDAQRRRHFSVSLGRPSAILNVFIRFHGESHWNLLQVSKQIVSASVIPLELALATWHLEKLPRVTKFKWAWPLKCLCNEIFMLKKITLTWSLRLLISIVKVLERIIERNYVCLTFEKRDFAQKIETLWQEFIR